MQISWQAQHFRKVNLFQSLNCVAGAALSKGQVQISWQAQHFRQVNRFVAGAAKAGNGRSGPGGPVPDGPVFASRSGPGRPGPRGLELLKAST